MTKKTIRYIILTDDGNKSVKNVFVENNLKPSLRTRGPQDPVSTINTTKERFPWRRHTHHIYGQGKSEARLLAEGHI